MRMRVRIGRMMIEKLYTCSFHHYAIAAASDPVFLHLAASIQRVHSVDDYMQLDVQGRAGSGGRGVKNMRPIDADDFIERLSHIPMVQEAIRKAMDKMPTIEPERKKGKWVGYDGDWLKTMCKCSECGAMIDVNEKYRNFFCYHCGARMDGGQGGEENR